MFGAITASGAQGQKGASIVISWSYCLNQKLEFYSNGEAVRIAENVLLYQRDTGGWQKNVDMVRLLSEEDKAEIRKARSKKDSTLDNSATITQIRYLAKVYNSTGLERFSQAILKAIDYLLDAQYPNGGWPQFYLWQGHADYSRYITFNDGAMIGAMGVLRDIAKRKSEYAFVDKNHRDRTERVVQKSIKCILKYQIIVSGERAAWCQQYDQETLEPRPARIYEKVSNCSSESVGIIKFLMDIDNPEPNIIRAIQSAVAWLDRYKLIGIRVVEEPNELLRRGFDTVVVQDVTAPPIWAHFYQMGTNRSIFCGRDGRIKYSLAEIDYERRTGYALYGYWPVKLLAEDYPAWRKKMGAAKGLVQ